MKKKIEPIRKIHNYLPSLTEATNSCSVQAHYNSKETVEIPLCFTAVTEKHNNTQVGHFLGQHQDAVY